ncbi:hypothetical protein FQN60_002783 [Etheostoma spectabile]|uniref:Globin domain-containing protein n=1 Tax=Etheostoma spectabile TaxID=54343 RepID=A0A5J5CH32_9PERO|nr:hypothetical protein FQN60_002783 [Etheostoma spectabile]
MVKWTDEERKVINSIFSNLDYNDVGPKALRRHFGSFGDLTTAAAIMKNAKVAAHGIKVLHGLDRALKNMDNIKDAYTELSILHSEKLHVDPDNFKLLADCLTIVIAAKMGESFTPATHTIWQKFLNVVVSALGKQYH